MKNTNNLRLRPAIPDDLESLWEIFVQAIERRRLDGSSQWQDGYPNPEVIREDINEKQAYVLLQNDKIVGYTAIIFNNEPAYDTIDGKWLTNGSFAVLHRIVIAQDQLGKGLASHILSLAEQNSREQGIESMRADTNYDNPGMIRTFEKAGYQFCGIVQMRGGERRAFEKPLS